ncbi:MAG: segregation and condensation protein A [Ignavibacteriales bacterium]
MARPVQWLPVRLGVFEGPLDLLLHLIEENEVDIYDIPIAEVAEQYLGYLRAMEELDLEIASEFLVMAATLLGIKARMLLPKRKVDVIEAPEPDPRQELVDMLLEYKKVKEAAASLKSLQQMQSFRFARNVKPLPAAEKQVEIGDVRLYDLAQRFRQILARQRPAFSRIVRESVSVRQKMKELLQWVAGAARGRGVSFGRFTSAAASKREVVVAFLALLELVRRRRIRIEQHKLFGDVKIFKAG